MHFTNISGYLGEISEKENCNEFKSKIASKLSSVLVIEKLLNEIAGVL